MYFADCIENPHYIIVNMHITLQEFGKALSFINCTQVHDTDSEITRGGRVVRRIARRIVQHKIIFAVVIIIVLAIIALLIFGIVEIKKSQNK